MIKIANARAFKRILASVAIAAVVAGGAPTAVLAQGANGVTWNFDEQTGTLTISGKGAMDDFGPKDSANAAPWSVNGYKIKSLVIEDGVTEIGDNAFNGLDNLTSAVVPETITSIGGGAFSGCYSLNNFGYGNNESKVALIKGNVTYLGQDAFYGCSGMDDIYLEATDLHDYHFDTLDSNVGWKYDFNNYQATTIHVSKDFGDHITLDQCESLYQWQRVAGDKAPIVADLDVEGTVKGDRGQQAEASKAASSQKSADKAAADGLKATSTENREAQKKLAAKRNAAVPGAKAASSQKAADKAAADGLKATSTEAREVAAEQAAIDGKNREAAADAKAQTVAKAEADAAAAGVHAANVKATSDINRELAAEAAKQDAADKAAAADAKAQTVAKAEADAAAAGALAAEVQVISAENRDLQADLAAKGAAAIANTKGYSKKAAKQAKEVGKKAKENEVPKKRDNDRPGR